MDKDLYYELILDKYLDEDNARIAKKLTDVYLLKNVNIPSVIVECGFLSNPEEDELMATEEYKDKMVTGMVNGIIEYLND